MASLLVQKCALAQNSLLLAEIKMDFLFKAKRGVVREMPIPDCHKGVLTLILP